MVNKKIGLTDTVFGVYSSKGYTWRYVPNERIPMLKLEKVINKDLHLDTEQEKADNRRSIFANILPFGSEKPTTTTTTTT